MQITISDDTYQRLVTHLERSGLPMTDVGKLADRTLRQSIPAAPPENGANANRSDGGLVEAFRQFRGAMKETSIEQLVADRHRGLK